MKVGSILRQIVMDRIMAEVPELGGRVYDKAVRTTPTPYVTLGPSDWTDDSADCLEGRLLNLQVDIWAKDVAKGEAEDLLDDVSACLNGWDDTDALTMHPIRVSMARVLDDPDPDWVHGVVQLEIMVEE